MKPGLQPKDGSFSPTALCEFSLQSAENQSDCSKPIFSTTVTTADAYHPMK